MHEMDLVQFTVKNVPGNDYPQKSMPLLNNTQLYRSAHKCAKNTVHVWILAIPDYL